MKYIPKIRQGYLSASEMARRIGIDINQLLKIVPPTHLVGKRFYYLIPEELEVSQAIDAYRAANRSYGDLKTRWRPQGCFNLTVSAEILGMPRQTLYLWIRRKEIDPPNIVGPGKYLYFTQPDLLKIKKTKDHYFKRKNEDEAQKRESDL